jgi:hypothetical protein
MCPKLQNANIDSYERSRFMIQAESTHYPRRA